MTTPFDRLMTRLDPAMTIVTAVADDERAGCLVGFHSQAGMTRNAFAVWLSKANHTYLTATRARYFAVHFLHDGDLDLARLFGTECGAETDKFARCAWTPGPEGVPLLDACLDHIVGTKHALVDTGEDHVCLVLDPVETSTSGDEFTPMRLSDVTDLDPAHEPGAGIP